MGFFKKGDIDWVATGVIDRHVHKVNLMCEWEVWKEIPMLAKKESTWISGKEGSYKTAYASFLSIPYLKNMDQTKYGSFIKKMAEDFATGWENVYPTHIEDVQHILSIHKYDPAYHDKQKKQQDDHNKVHMPSKNDNHSTTGNVPNIVEMSFAQMEG